MLRFSESLKKNHEFKRLYRRGKSEAGRYLVVYSRRNGTRRNRVGITVSNKVGNSVTRNKLRRRLREIYRLAEPGFKRGFDIVTVARVSARLTGYNELRGDFLRLCDKLGLRLTDVKDETVRSSEKNGAAG